MEQRWEEDLKIMGIRNWHAVARYGKEWGALNWQFRDTTDLKFPKK